MPFVLVLLAIVFACTAIGYLVGSPGFGLIVGLIVAALVAWQASGSAV